MQDIKKIKKNDTSTPYDDAHRTMLNDCPWLIIPVVNEMFQKNVTGMGCMQINKLAAPFQCLFKCFL